MPPHFPTALPGPAADGPFPRRADPGNDGDRTRGSGTGNGGDPPDPGHTAGRTGSGNRGSGEVKAAGRRGAARTADPDGTREQLRQLRPELVARFDRELPGARAAVLARLLGAVDREPLPGLRHRRPGAATFDGGVELSFPPEAGIPFAPGPPGLAATVTRRGGGPRAVTDPAELVRTLWGEGALAAEVANSVANLALARAGRRVRPPGATGGETARDAVPGELGAPDGPGRQDHGPGTPGGPRGTPGTFGEQSRALERTGWQDGRSAARHLARAEQSLTDGHPLHPCCRTRGGMTVEDVLRYAPEHSPVVRLRRLRVPADRWYGDGEPVLLAHPWQAERLRDRHPWLADDGATGPAFPLMSLRTVAPADGGPHVKTAVDVQLTSAVRTVSPAAVHNGPLLSRLLKGLTADLPIEILAELTAGAVIVDGVPQRRLAHLTREAPRLRAGEVVLPAAALGGVRPENPHALIADLARKLIAPAVVLLGRGVALEAHGQNTLVVLRGGRISRVLYRDLGGVRVSPARLRRHGVQPPPLHGDLPTDDPEVLRTKLAAALGTVVAGLVGAWSGYADQAGLWSAIAAAVRATGTADAARLLSDPLPVKATTAMRLAADPLHDVWAGVDNPLAAYA